MTTINKAITVSQVSGGDVSPAVGTDITACTDYENGIDYVLSQSSTRNIVMRTADTVPSDSSTFGAMHVLPPLAAYSSKLRCIYDGSNDGSVVVYYQDDRRKTQLSYLRMSPDGDLLDNGVVASS